MRFKDIGDKEIIDVNNGERLGVLGQTDIEFNPVTGKIDAFLIPNYKWFGLRKEGSDNRIAWEEIQTIGKHMILIRT
ncbi:MULTISPECIES: YlmC/YmxH family sporulation protein [Bacillaceae]|uniref:Sporulation protein, YlmC/YmxH family n=2 Tax=Terribacillus saccharophilus TaxID=361277 RepID=A0A1H8ALX3_9BACI|nr:MULTISPECIES: YlmC/YmxH family sporulation protein [Bacillaceae]AIF66422.1 hypothetical protein GZ22_07110 [Terribacillus goriensis]MCM3224876.1 YlmC/YmxH family sporulation protein [Terribacillus saccharophilus]MEC0283204.1 YlmC/YmxH family sporulation protein [Terribacillus saccharophilus]MEC0290160.1 YlmC/YmxH family sporulation protein [Terribacillus saccharophilus]MEC0302945.1 YlmC/YmxH family sporulation protein [Terribacillus saccharophilus]